MRDCHIWQRGTRTVRYSIGKYPLARYERHPFNATAGVVSMNDHANARWLGVFTGNMRHAFHLPY